MPAFQSDGTGAGVAGDGRLGLGIKDGDQAYWGGGIEERLGLPAPAVFLGPI